MKIRSGFVSNSSSASFVANLDRLTEDQIDIILAYPSHAEAHDGWSFSVDADKGLLTGYTIMDNGDLEEYLEKHGILNTYKIDSGW
jgi:hypothetical protein